MPPRKYEGVRLYSDVTNKEVRATKRALLKEMAMSGNTGMKNILRDEVREGYPDAYDRADTGINTATTDATVALLDEERNRMMGGLDVARGMHGTAHSKAMDRMAARNVSYADAMRHAAKLSRHALKKEIAAMKLAAEERRSAGGGGYSGNYDTPSLIPPGDEDDQETPLNRQENLFMRAAADYFGAGLTEDRVENGLAPILINNQDNMLRADTRYTSYLAQGMTPQEAQGEVYRDLRTTGLGGTESLVVADAVGRTHGAPGFLDLIGGTVPRISNVANHPELMAQRAPSPYAAPPRTGPGSSAMTPVDAAPRPTGFDFSGAFASPTITNSGPR